MPDGHRREGQTGQHEPEKARTPEPDDQRDSGCGETSPPPRQVRVPAFVGRDNGRARGKPLSVVLDDL